MRRTVVVRSSLLLVAVSLALAGCAAAPPKSSGAAAAKFCGVMVTNSGGLHDRSFNETSWSGLQQAQKKYGITAKVLVSNSANDLAPNTKAAVATGCGFVLTVGYELNAATTEQAAANPAVHFAIVDETVDAPNVKPIVFDTAQAAFLAGYLAAGVSKTGVVATFGGGNQPPVTLFMDGFVDGVAKYNQAHGTTVRVIGWDKTKQDGVFTGDFEDVSKGLVTTQGLIGQGADVILPVAGQVGEGAAEAALEAGKVSVIWVDNDGYDTLPTKYRGILLTSVIKNTGDAVVQTAHAAQDGSFSKTPYIGTLKNGGVAIAPFHDRASSVPPALSDEVAALKAAIIAGNLVVASPSAPK